MNPNAAHIEFWTRLAKRFGVDWYERFGSRPSDEWCALLDRFSPAQIDAALEAMSQREWFGLPSHPQIAKLLESAAAKHPAAGESTDHLRAYWRSAVLGDIEHTGPLLNLWRYGHRMQDLDEATRHFVMREAKLLIDRLCEMERERGARTPEILHYMSTHIWRLLARLVPAPRATARKTS